MPRIQDSILNCSVYVYKTHRGASEGEELGASGFLVGVPLKENPSWYQLYVVTNRHVISKRHDHFLRLNRSDGRGTEIFKTNAKDWIDHPHGDDIAVLPLDIPVNDVSFWFVDSSFLVTPSIMSAMGIGAGDDVFMIGRFLTHDGKQRNTPTVRFGNIAMMPLEPIEHPEFKINQETFLVECRSMPGYSGSPVFIYKGSMTYLSQRLGGGLTSILPQEPYLLGVDWCHLNGVELVRDKNGEPLSGGLHIRNNSGMAAVVPAWRLLEILNLEKLEKQRKKDDEQISKRRTDSKVGLD